MSRSPVLLAALISCTFEPGAPIAATTSSDPNNCPAGQEGCLCFEGLSCLSGLVCFQGQCIYPNEGSTTGSATGSESTNGGSTSHDITVGITVGSTNSNSSESTVSGSTDGTSSATGSDESTSESTSGESSDTENQDCIPYLSECINPTQYRVCNAQGQWDPPINCMYQACVDGKCSGECLPGTKRCLQNEIQRCNDVGIWETQTDCESLGKVCEDGNCVETCTPWVWQFGTNQRDEAIGVAVDSSSSAYITGFTQGSFDNNSFAGGKDIFIAKISSAGKKVWTRQLGTAADEEGYEIAMDNSNHVTITGYTDGALDGETSVGGRDIFITKFNSGGGKQWTRQLGTPLNDSGHGLAVDGLGNAYLVGRTNGVFDGNSSAGGEDFFVMNIDSAGTWGWTRQFGTSRDDHGIGVALNQSENRVYITGYTEGGLNGNPSAGDKDIFLLKLKVSGNTEWTQQWGNEQWDEGYAVAVDGSGNAYITGVTGGDLEGNGNSGQGDFFVAKYNASGTKLWVKQFGTSGMDSGLGIAVDDSGTSYITGPTNGAFPGNSSAGLDDIFVAKVDTNGNKVWIRQMGTSAGDWGIGVALDGIGNPIVAGYAGGKLGGQPWAGDRDVFVARICSDGTVAGTI